MGSNMRGRTSKRRFRAGETDKIIDCKIVVFFAFVIRMRAVFKRKVWSECEYGEWEHVRLARFAREYPHFPRFRRFAPLRASQREKRLFCSLIKSSLKSFIIDGGYAVFSKLELLNQTYFTFLAYHCIRGFMWFRRPRGTQYTLMSYSY